jgi:ribosomal protein S18 acetylase RimI-like enzyme
MIRTIQPEDNEELVQLIAQFRVTMSRFYGRAEPHDVEAAEVELARYEDPSYKVFVAEEENQELTGYFVCRVFENKVYAETLFVRPEYRRQGIGTALYEKAETLVEELDLETVYNQVHPNNDRMIGFLLKRGYNVLNMIEVRRSRSREKNLQRIKVGKNSFEYCC